jgi:hypothetical protein
MARFRAIKSNRAGTVFFLFGSAALLLRVVASGISPGRAPLGNMYEFSLADELTFTLAYLVIGMKCDLRWVGLLIALLLLIVFWYSSNSSLSPEHTTCSYAATDLVGYSRGYWGNFRIHPPPFKCSRFHLFLARSSRA